MKTCRPTEKANDKTIYEPVNYKYEAKKYIRIYGLTCLKS